jgi:hypothetical protein
MVGNGKQADLETEEAIAWLTSAAGASTDGHTAIRIRPTTLAPRGQLSLKGVSDPGALSRD